MPSTWRDAEVFALAPEFAQAEERAWQLLTTDQRERGRFFPKFDRGGRPRRYVSGHNVGRDPLGRFASHERG